MVEEAGDAGVGDEHVVEVFERAKREPPPGRDGVDVGGVDGGGDGDAVVALQHHAGESEPGIEQVDGFTAAGSDRAGDVAKHRYRAAAGSPGTRVDLDAVLKRIDEAIVHEAHGITVGAGEHDARDGEAGGAFGRVMHH